MRPSKHKRLPTDALDCFVFGSLMKYISTACDDWIKNHFGKVMTIHDISSINEKAFLAAASPKNFRNGFKARGIVPYDQLVILVIFCQLMLQTGLI